MALSSTNVQLSEAYARERKISERVESLIEDLQFTKERQAHERQVFEKEVRKARKDAFRAGSALVKLQEDLKEARTETSNLRKDVQKEKEAKELARQEAFERAYTLSGQVEEIESMRERLRSLEAERDTARLGTNAEKIAEPKSDAHPPSSFLDRPTREGVSEKQYINNTMTWLRGVVRGDEPEELDELRWTIEGLKFQLGGTLHEVEEQKKNVEFRLMECQGKLCPCRMAEMRGEIYIYDQEKHDRQMAHDEAFAQRYHEELERLKPVREATQAQEAEIEAQRRAEWEANAPARAERQRKWEERRRQLMEKSPSLELIGLEALAEALSSNRRSASTREPASITDANPRPSQTDVAFSPTTGAFCKAPTPPASTHRPYFSKVDFRSGPTPDDPMSVESLPEENKREIKNVGPACRRMGEDLGGGQKNRELQEPIDLKTTNLNEGLEDGREDRTPDKEPIQEATCSRPLREPSVAHAISGRDVHDAAGSVQGAERGNQEIITHSLARPPSALTMAGDSPVRRIPNSPTLSASSSVPALAPPEEVLVSDDEGDIIPSARASDAHVATRSRPSQTLDEGLDVSLAHTPLRPRSQIIGATKNIATTTTTVPLRGLDDMDGKVSPAPGTPGTPVSREAALAQIRARRDRARSVVLKETKSAPGTPARRGLAGGLSILRSAGPGQSVEKAREFSAHSNAF